MPPATVTAFATCTTISNLDIAGVPRDIELNQTMPPGLELPQILGFL